MPAATQVLDLVEDIRSLLNRAASGERLSFYQREMLGLKIVCLRHELAQLPKKPAFPPEPAEVAPRHVLDIGTAYEQPERQD